MRCGCTDCRSKRWRFLQALRTKPKETMLDLCRWLGVARSTGYKWKRRFYRDGETQERSRCPKRCGRSKVERWRAQVRVLRERHRCGAGKVRWYLRQQHPGVVLPSERTIHRWLVSEGLVKRRRWRAPVGPQVRQARPIGARRPNSVWSIDFKGSFYTQDKSLVQALTITDVYSHYLLAVQTVKALSVQAVRVRLKKVFRRYGLPRAIRVDHGVPWHGPGSRGWTQLAVWWVRLGIAVEYIALNGNASHEQMHRMLKARTANPPAESFAGQQARFGWWKRYYNHQRPHEGAGQMPPATKYRPSIRPLPPSLPKLNYPATWKTLQVDAYGYVQWHQQKRSIGRGFAGERIGLRPLSRGADVYLGTHLIGTLLPHEPALRPVELRGDAVRLPNSPSAQGKSGEGAAPLPLRPIPDSCLRCHGRKLSTM